MRAAGKGDRMRRWSRTTVAASAFAACLLGAGSGADAQAPDPALRADLIAVYRVTISQDLCDFALTDDEIDKVERASDQLEKRLQLEELEAQQIYDQVEQSMTQQKPAGLCDAKGPWAREFRRTLDQLK